MSGVMLPDFIPESDERCGVVRHAVVGPRGEVELLDFPCLFYPGVGAFPGKVGLHVGVDILPAARDGIGRSDFAIFVDGSVMLSVYAAIPLGSFDEAVLLDISILDQQALLLSLLEVNVAAIFPQLCHRRFVRTRLL